jgi:hypothetical protein
LAEVYSGYDIEELEWKTTGTTTTANWITFASEDSRATVMMGSDSTGAVYLQSDPDWDTPATITKVTPEGHVVHVVLDYLEMKKHQFKTQMKSNLLIKFSTRRTWISQQVPEPEIRARETLRDMLSEAEWRRYMTNGFVMIRGNKGYWYQVFNDQRHVKVFKDNKICAEICIHTVRSCPPTDHILNAMTLIRFDEDAFWRLGNVHHRLTETRLMAV